MVPGALEGSALKPLRVLHVRSCRGITDITGAETYLLSLLQGFDPGISDCLLLCITDPRHGQTPWLRELTERRLRFGTIPVEHPLSLRDFAAFPSWMRRFAADIVHTHDHRADVVGIAWARATGRRSVASFHGWTNWPAHSTRGRLYPWLDRHALRLADTIIVDSAAMAGQLRWRGDGPRVLVIPNGVDTRKFDPARVTGSLPRRWFDQEAALVVGMVGRIHPNKGQLDFLEAAAGVLRSHPHCRFLIVGEAPPGYEEYKQQVTRFIADHGLQAAVLVTDVARGEIPTVMASIDILVAPSYMESFSFSLLEAMAMQKPIVATRVGGNPELITDGETGILVPPGDVQGLTQTLRALIDDPDRRSRLGCQARRKVEADFSIDRMIARTLQTYQEVLSRPSGPR